MSLITFFSDVCIQEFLSLTFTIPCFKHLTLKSLSLSILLGSLLIKLPQIFKIIQNRSVLGISESSLVLELLSATCMCLYSYLSNFPFLTYGETFFIAVQGLVLNFLFWSFSRVRLVPRLLLFVVLSFLTTLAALNGIPQEGMYILASLPISLNFLARVPQIYLNFKTKSTGQLAFLTFAFSLAGNLARVGTTVATLSDPVTLAGYVTAAMLNGLIVVQMFWFANKQKI
jgi:mannose-P-dolichol utilization defect protein 1